MRRADRRFLNWATWLCLVTSAGLGGPGFASAQSARFTIIDARNGLTDEVRAAYAEAMGAHSESPMVKSRIKVLVNPSSGAVFEAIDLPEHVRNVELDIDLIVPGGRPLTQDVALNHLSVARRLPARIAQHTIIQGQ